MLGFHDSLVEILLKHIFLPKQSTDEVQVKIQSNFYDYLPVFNFVTEKQYETKQTNKQNTTFFSMDLWINFQILLESLS